ncbi:MAG: hypothetical protein WAK03_17625, partial [Methylocystis sp.]
ETLSALAVQAGFHSPKIIIVFHIEIMRETDIRAQAFMLDWERHWRRNFVIQLTPQSLDQTTIQARQVIKMMRDNEVNNPRLQLQQKREAAVRALLGRSDGKLSQEAIEELKKDLGVSRATAYRMIKTFRTCGAVIAPSTRPVGRPKGARVLDPKREFLIHDAIRSFYLRPLRPKFSELVQEIGRRCREERLPAPNWRTIKARLHDVLMQTDRR